MTNTDLSGVGHAQTFSRALVMRASHIGWHGVACRMLLWPGHGPTLCMPTYCQAMYAP